MLAEPPGWTVEAAVATYQLTEPAGSPGSERVAVFGKAHNAWFVSVIDPGGVARSTVSAQLLGYARQVAEGQVRNRSV